MEERLAAAPVDHLRGVQAYHALTYGWLLSGLARAVTGKGMRELIRQEVARPLNTDGLHLGRPPEGSPTRPAQVLIPHGRLRAPVFNFIAPKVAGLPFSGALGAMYFPGVISLVKGDTPFLDGEVPAANGVVTGRGLAKMYAVLANDGRIDGKKYLSEELASGLTGEQRRKWPDANMVVPMPFHLGYHESPVPGLLRGFGHVGLGGTLGWADPEAGSSFGFIHNRLLTPLLFDMGSFAGLARPLRNAIEAARHQGSARGAAVRRDLSQTRAANGDSARLALQPARDECCRLSRHTGLSVRTVCLRVETTGTCRIVRGAHVDGLWGEKRADVRKAARYGSCKHALWIAEEGDRGHVVGRVRRDHCGSHIDDAGALRHSCEHLFGVGAPAGQVLDMGRRVVGADGRALGELEGRGIVDRVDVHRPPADLGSERIDECVAHFADAAGRPTGAAGERHLDVGARVGVCGRAARWADKERRHHRDCSAYKAGEAANVGSSHGPNADTPS